MGGSLPSTATGSGAMGNLTQPGNTDVFFIDKEMNKVVKRVEMVDLIEQAVE